MSDGRKAWAEDQEEEEARQLTAKIRAWERAMKWLTENDIVPPASPRLPLDEEARRALRDFVHQLTEKQLGKANGLRCKAEKIEKQIKNPFETR